MTYTFLESGGARGTEAVGFRAPEGILVTKWGNHAAIAAPRNGSTTHTVDPNGGTVVTGANFVPTAGRFLIVVVEGGVTSDTPTDWTLEASAVSSTGLYVWSRTAAGSDTITTTHNAPDYPVMFHWFEFRAGATWVSDVSSTSTAASGANPNLTGLTGTKLVMAAKAQSSGTAAPNPRSASWSASTVEVLDTQVLFSGTDGYYLTIGYQESYTSASYAPTATLTNGGVVTCEALTWAIQV